MAKDKKRKRIPGEGLVKMSMAAIWSEAMLLAQIDSNFLLCRTRAIVLWLAVFCHQSVESDPWAQSDCGLTQAYDSQGPTHGVQQNPAD